jgi:hypothetical protein
VPGCESMDQCVDDYCDVKEKVIREVSDIVSSLVE